ncbi:uncharacterized protein CG13380-like [Centruroides sculpturatus]|uniref:uncharacterized protein CG13380-like n=1 Tax=Centruroides sculpturatus TaxID=218467 RepID=UPI000C6EAA32|nr:uncharacterized protein CG13380-like [Centruroides sculpturatus]
MSGIALPSQMIDQNDKQCICERPKGVIFCTSCGMFDKGRIRTSCEIHPRMIYLMDWDNFCPNCRGQMTLVEYQSNRSESSVIETNI